MGMTDEEADRMISPETRTFNVHFTFPIEAETPEVAASVALERIAQAGGVWAHVIAKDGSINVEVYAEAPSDDEVSA